MSKHQVGEQALQESASGMRSLAGPRTGNATPRRRPRIHLGHWQRLLFLLPVLIYLPLLFGYPLVYSIKVSLEKFTIYSVLNGNAPFVGLDNLRTVLNDPLLSVATVNTIVFTVVSIGCQYAIGMSLALLFNRKFPLNGVLRSVLLLPWLLPSIVSTTAWRWLFDETNGLIDQVLLNLHIVSTPIGWLSTSQPALAAVIITNIWIGIPFNLVLLYSGLQSIPQELFEAAAVDGAGRWMQFRHITVPLLRSVTAIILMLGLIYTIKQFDIIYILTGGGPGDATQLFSTWSYSLSFTNYQFGRGAAVGDIMMVISLAVALVYIFFTQRDEIR